MKPSQPDKKNTSLTKAVFLLIPFLICCYFASELLAIVFFALYSITIFPIHILADYTDFYGYEAIRNALENLEEVVIFIIIGIGFICFPILMALGKVQGEAFSSSGSLGLREGSEQKSKYKQFTRFFFYLIRVVLFVISIYGMIITILTFKTSIIYSFFFFVPAVGFLGLILRKKWANIYCSLLFLVLASLFFHLPFTLEFVRIFWMEISVSIILVCFFSLCSYFLIFRSSDVGVEIS